MRREIMWDLALVKILRYDLRDNRSQYSYLIIEMVSSYA